MDSLGAVELRNAIAGKFGISVPATLAFDYPTLALLADFVAATMLPAAAAPSAVLLEDRSSFLTATVDELAIAAQIAAVIAGVLGASVAPDQPLMEVLLPILTLIS